MSLRTLKSLGIASLLFLSVTAGPVKRQTNDQCNALATDANNAIFMEDFFSTFSLVQDDAASACQASCTQLYDVIQAAPWLNNDGVQVAPAQGNPWLSTCDAVVTFGPSKGVDTSSCALCLGENDDNNGLAIAYLWNQAIFTCSDAYSNAQEVVNNLALVCDSSSIQRRIPFRVVTPFKPRPPLVGPVKPVTASPAPVRLREIIRDEVTNEGRDQIKEQYLENLQSQPKCEDPKWVFKQTFNGSRMCQCVQQCSVQGAISNNVLLRTSCAGPVSC